MTIDDDREALIDCAALEALRIVSSFARASGSYMKAT